ncbi:MAG: glutathione-disulfide reductase, partial [Burkholderiales bacterium]
AAHYGDAFEEARGFGWDVQEPAFDWQRLKKNRAAEISRLNGVYEGLLGGAGVRLLRGWARLADANTVEISGEGGSATQRHSAKHILVATGSKPTVPDFPGCELAVVSDALFDLEPFPKRLVVVGGGYIGCEFASIFNGLGSKVTQIYRGKQILRGFDGDVRNFVADEMRKTGVDLRLETDVDKLARSAGCIALTLKNGEVIEADSVLYATGRDPNVKGLGLDAVGVKQDPNGAVVVDEHYQSSVPSVCALGDVIDRIQLTPTALGEAMALVDRLFGNAQREMSYDFIPTAVFTHPNIGTVGYSEDKAREKFGAVTIYRTDFKPLKHTLSGSNERTMMKLIVEDKTDRVVGLHMVGADAGEIVQGFAVAMKAGATKAVFDSTIGIHPTSAEEFVTMREPVRAG